MDADGHRCAQINQTSWAKIVTETQYNQSSLDAASNRLGKTHRLPEQFVVYDIVGRVPYNI